MNEYSARYSEVQDRFYHPQVHEVGLQSQINRQGTGENSDILTAQQFIDELESMEKLTYGQYEEDLRRGISRELARMKLPINVYTE